MFEELPTEEDRHKEIIKIVSPLMKRNVDVLDGKIEKTNERIAKIKRELNLDEIKNQLKTVIRRPEMESRFNKTELANQELDKNFQMMIGDFWQFQKAINHMHKSRQGPAALHRLLVHPPQCSAGSDHSQSTPSTSF